ncbi:GNAT family N-acetyltransferase [Bradyrhizobium manausense]|uniref:GNAT family N-acetyltransferase n=1 Tax=Bradyrhizobium manausense TaxID=989370 RepID=UPI001BA677B2|nr:GNAT family N-acetyltransferase [Bradyrhizobium manausense]MBR0689917.1 GNAT family N-acetyltransferase [Bradyrhizobium manausense]
MMDPASFDIIPADPTLRLRPASPIDAPFIRHLFEQVRTGQFAATGLSGPILDQILEQQFRSQAAGYAAQFPNAISLIVARDGAAIGRLLLHCTDEYWHVIDIALLPSECGRGIGTNILDALEASARRQGAGALTLVVLTSNPAARRFYQRQGFAEVRQAGAAHIAMRKDITESAMRSG